MRIAHAVDVADLPGEIEDDLAVAHEVVHRARLPDVGDVDAHAILDARDVEEVAAVVGNERVDEQDVGAEIDEAAREVAADEPEPAGDHHAAAAIELARGGHSTRADRTHRTRPCVSARRHGVISDSSSTAVDSFEAPCRRSTNTIGTSAMRRPAAAA